MYLLNQKQFKKEGEDSKIYESKLYFVNGNILMVTSLPREYCKQ